MISHGKDMKLFTGNANPGLAKDICNLIGIQLGHADIGHFADGEVSDPSMSLFAVLMYLLSSPPAAPSTTT